MVYFGWNLLWRNPMKFIKYLNESKDVSTELLDFLQKNIDPSDNEIHSLAEKLNVEPDDLEAMIYSLSTDFWANGRYNEKGKNMKFDEKELAAGIKVEMEHTTNKEIARRIALDHLTEIPGTGKGDGYYSLLKKMEKDAGVEE